VLKAPLNQPIWHRMCKGLMCELFILHLYGSQYQILALLSNVILFATKEVQHNMMTYDTM